MNCINRNSPEFIKLAKDTGIHPMILLVQVAKWQEKNGIDTFPSVEELTSNTQENVISAIPTKRKEKEEDLGISIPATSFSNDTIKNIKKVIRGWNNLNDDFHYRASEILRDSLSAEEQKGKSPYFRKIVVEKYPGKSKAAEERVDAKQQTPNVLEATTLFDALIAEKENTSLYRDEVTETDVEFSEEDFEDSSESVQVGHQTNLVFGDTRDDLTEEEITVIKEGQKTVAEEDSKYQETFSNLRYGIIKKIEMLFPGHFLPYNKIALSVPLINRMLKEQKFPYFENMKEFRDLYKMFSNPIAITQKDGKLIVTPDILINGAPISFTVSVENGVATIESINRETSVSATDMVYSRLDIYGKNNISDFITEESPVPLVDSNKAQIHKFIIEDSPVVFAEASEKTVSKIKALLDKAGISLISLKQFSALKGKVYSGVNGLADIAGKIIAVAEGKENVAITEEFVHVATAMIESKRPEVISRLIRNIDKFKIYKIVLEQYSKDPDYQLPDGRPNIRKIKKEAIDKLIAELIIQDETGSTSSPELLEIETQKEVLSWWREILETIRDIFSSVSIDDYNQVAKLIMEGNFDYKADTSNYTETFAQKTTDKQQEAIASILNPAHQLRHTEISEEEQKKNVLLGLDEATNFYEVQQEDGTWKKVLHRVTDRIKEVQSKIFKGKSFTEDEKEFFSFLQQEGTKFHAFFEDVSNRYFNSDGTKKDKTSATQLSLSIQERKFYSKIETTFKTIISQHTKNGVAPLVLSEQTIFDSTYRTGEAGSIDLLIIDAEGTASIYDWKFQNYQKSKEDIAWYKQDAYNIQLSRYADVLRKQYGIKKFDKIRVIPIQMDINRNYDKVTKTYGTPKVKDLLISDLTKEETNLLLMPVSAAEESTGDEQIDSLLKDLNSVWETVESTLKVSSEEDREFKVKELNKLRMVIRLLQQQGQVYNLLGLINDFNTHIDSLVAEYKMNYEGIQKTPENSKEISDFLNEIKNMYDVIEVFQNVSDIATKNYTEKMDDRLMKEAFTNSTAKIRANRGLLEKMQREILENTIAKFHNVSGILDIEKVFQGIGSYFKKFSDIPLASLKLLKRILDLANHTSVQNTQADIERLVELKEQLKGVGNIKDLIGKLYQTDQSGAKKNKLIFKYNTDFYKGFEENKEAKDYQWLLDNVDLDAAEKEINEIVTKKLSHYKRTISDPIEFKKAKEDLLKKYNFKDREFNNYGLYVFKKHPKDIWLSTEFTEISKNKPLLDLYDFIQDMNKRAADSGYISYKETRSFIPFLRKSFMEELSFGANKFSLPDINITVKKYAETQSGNINSLTGEKIHSLPKYFTYDFTNEGVDFSEDLFQTLGMYSSHLNKYIEYSKVEGQVNVIKNVERLKDHLTTTKFGETVEGGRALQRQSGNVENTKLFDDFLRKVFYEENYTWADGDLIVDNPINNIAKQVNKAAGKEIWNEERGKISLTKTLEAVNNYFYLKVLSGNIFTSLSNYFGFNVQTSTQAGKYYQYRDILSAQGEAAGNLVNKKDKYEAYIALTKATQPFKEGLQSQINKLGLTSLTRVSVQNILMSTMRQPDLFAEQSMFIALLNNTMIKDGKFVNIRVETQREFEKKYTNTVDYYANKSELTALIKQRKEENSVYNIMKFENGKLEIPGFNGSIEEFSRLASLNKRLFEEATGNPSANNPNYMGMSVYTKSLMVMKNWIAPFVETRFSSFKQINDEFSQYIDENGVEQGQRYEIGRVNLFVGVLFKSVISLSTDIIDLTVMNEKGQRLVAEKLIQYREEYKRKTGKELTITETQLAEIIQNSLQKQSKELGLLLALISISFSSGLFEPDDDDDRATKNAFRYMQKVINKFKDEVSFFYSPSNWGSVISKGGIFPAIGVFTDISKFFSHFGQEMTGIDFDSETTDEEAIKAAHPIKYLMKLAPITKEMINWLAVFSEDFAEGQDVTIQAEYNR